MNLQQAIISRHSVRSYLEKEIAPKAVSVLQSEIENCNREGGLHIQLVTNEPRAFNTFMAHYGRFSGVSNYIVLAGKKEAGLEERLGYYGERIVLLAQTLGLNTCWVAMSFGKEIAKSFCNLARGEKIVCVISIGYGKNQGTAHKSKAYEAVCKADEPAPEWFKRGVESALLAPTAINQQRFMFTLFKNTVFAKSTGGFYSAVDLGIAKYHFEIGAGKENFVWKE